MGTPRSRGSSTCVTIRRASGFQRTARKPPEQLFQGPVADALTHVGQLAMLRRMAWRADARRELLRGRDPGRIASGAIRRRPYSNSIEAQDRLKGTARTGASDRHNTRTRLTPGVVRILATGRDRRERVARCRRRRDSPLRSQIGFPLRPRLTPGYGPRARPARTCAFVSCRRSAARAASTARGIRSTGGTTWRRHHR